jgi:ATP-dependent Lhr-like helicase
VQAGATCLVSTAEQGSRWWTFAGWKANLALGEALAPLRQGVSGFDDLGIALDRQVNLSEIGEALRSQVPAMPAVNDRALEGLKFADCLPKDLAAQVLAQRLLDSDSVQTAVEERLTGWRE